MRADELIRVTFYSKYHASLYRPFAYLGAISATKKGEIIFGRFDGENHDHAVVGACARFAAVNDYGVITFFVHKLSDIA